MHTINQREPSEITGLVNILSLEIIVLKYCELLVLILLLIASPSIKPGKSSGITGYW